MKMPEPQSLLRPLRSDSLKPRPSTQAVWEPDQPTPAPSIPDLNFAPQADAAQTEEPEPSLDLDAAIAAVLSEPDEEDDPSDEPDALSTDQMPEPVFVPLYEDIPPKRKGKGWLWPVLIVLAAGIAYAAWHSGWLTINLP